MTHIDARRLGRAALVATVVLAAGCSSNPVAGIEKADRILAESLTAGDPALSALALEVHRDLDRSAPEDALRELVRHQRPSVRFTALLVKAEQARRSDLSFFEWVYLEEEDPSVRLAAVYGMASLGSHRRMVALADGLADRRAVVRRNAAMILGLLGNRSAAPMLKQHLRDADPVVRLNVAEAMARLGDTSGLPLIREMAVDAESPLQVNAILALGRVGTPARDIGYLRTVESVARTPLRGTRQPGSDSAARLAAFCARGQLGDYSQMPALIELAGGKTSRRLAPGHRAFALQLLARVAYSPARAQVADCLDDGHPYVRLSAAWAILSFSAPRSRQVRQAMTDYDPPQMLSEEDILRPAPRASPDGRPQNPTNAGPRGPWNSPLRPNFP